MIRVRYGVFFLHTITSTYNKKYSIIPNNNLTTILQCFRTFARNRVIQEVIERKIDNHITCDYMIDK